MAAPRGTNQFLRLPAGLHHSIALWRGWGNRWRPERFDWDRRPNQADTAYVTSECRTMYKRLAEIADWDDLAAVLPSRYYAVKRSSDDHLRGAGANAAFR